MFDTEEENAGLGYVVPEPDDDYEDPPLTPRDRLRHWGPLLVVLAVLGTAGTFLFAEFAGLMRTAVRFPDFAKSTCAADDSRKALVEVQRGATGKDIGDALFDAGVVRSSEAFVSAADHNESARDISAGTYRVCTRISAATAITELLKSANLSSDSLIEIRPGDYSWETIHTLADKRGWNRDDVQQLVDANQIGLPAWSKGADGHWTAEGMLEPGRYILTSTDTAQGVLSEMVKARVDELDEIGLPAKATKLKCAPKRHCTPEEALIVASLAEAEVQRPDPDGREVAEAVQNRLSSGDYLGVDATTRYWLSLQAESGSP